MPRLNGTGPEGQGPQTGRKLGSCSELSEEEKLLKLGKGRGKKRKSGDGQGRGKRLKSGLK
jgi:hypothetical protein